MCSLSVTRHWAWVSCLIFSWTFVAQAQTPSSAGPSGPPGGSPPALQLAELETLALRNNPTLAQAQAAIEAAAGRRKQAGLWPNPVVGYEGEGLAFDPRVRSLRSGNYLFFEQTILGFGKLAKSKAIATEEQSIATTNAAAQQLRVVNAVRLLYYETLGAQQLVEMRRQLATLTREAVTISEDLYNVGQADRPDVLSTEVELQRAEIELLRAENDWARAWQTLAAVVNEKPLMAQFKPPRLAGSLEEQAPIIKQDELLTALLANSPEIKAAQTNIARAKAVIARARIEWIPDVFLRGGLGKSNEFEDLAGRRIGWEARLEAGARVPLFNRNQGNIGAAKADLLNAESELQRVELALRARVAESYTRYLSSLGIAARYQRDILPRAQKAYELYLAKFRQMAAAYPQALIAQRTLIQVRTEYIGSLVELWQNVAQLRGQLLVGGLDAPGGMSTANINSNADGGEH